MKKRNTIICSLIKILIDRDGITYDEAKQLVIECRDTLLEAPSTTLSDDIIVSYLDLESDYIFDILDI